VLCNKAEILGHMAKHKSSDHIQMNRPEKICTGLATADTASARTLGAQQGI